jgi:biopolymer transport protein ExbD
MSSDVRWGTDESKPLNSPDELKEYIKNLVERFKDRPDYELRLYLRGDQQALFKGSREVIRVGAECGVIKVLFAVLPAKQPKAAAQD